ncbi:hypothetical protein M2447_002216 [Ereboglobus sp. PH5-10]|uniref:hypothetical protein n=1 Tax=Ereboglobus sp. PH5-10 TaxID=2940629 RepID=UPI00240768CB|nr:hypothetical protein [Ereboglobus sp. PH5-10]MDF9828103.1 hypothetical protein [Ereboglobus sp. PH5-10]
MTSPKFRRRCAAYQNANSRAFAFVALAFCALMMLAPAAVAADASAESTARTTPDQKWFVDAGLLTHISSDLSGLGFNIRGGRYIGAADRLTLDMGACFDLDPKVTGRFSYYRSGSSTIYHDGKIEIKQTVIPVLFGWQHEWKTKSGRFACAFGPTVGAAYIDASEERNPRVSNASNVMRSDDGVAFMYGATLSLRWNILRNNDRFYVDCSVAALGATKVKLDKFCEDINLSGGRLVAGIGYRF